jgi:hypothetical protein
MIKAQLFAKRTWTSYQYVWHECLANATSVDDCLELSPRRGSLLVLGRAQTECNSPPTAGLDGVTVDEGLPELAATGRAVFDAAFGERVRALLRARPLTASDTGRAVWAEHRYDLPTLALAAIDAIIARQGFADELTYDEAVAALSRLARVSHPHRPDNEHEQVAFHVVDTLLNRREREAPFRYRVSDFTLDTDRVVHRALTVEFRLVTEHESATGDTVVLRATADAINALVGGLEFDVADEQAANDLMLTREHGGRPIRRRTMRVACGSAWSVRVAWSRRSSTSKHRRTFRRCPAPTASTAVP